MYYVSSPFTSSWAWHPVLKGVSISSVFWSDMPLDFLSSLPSSLKLLPSRGFMVGQIILDRDESSLAN